MNIYLETSIFNRYFDVDPDFHPATLQLFDEIKAGKFMPFTSRFVVDELTAAEATKPQKSQKMLNLIT
jgi:predicted nucleic acid-binding protein